MRTISLILFSYLLSIQLWAQVPTRPPVWGIAKMTFLVSSHDLAESYYGKFLGFDEAFSYPGHLGKIHSFKINDRQFLEFIEDKNAKEKTRFVSLSLETEDVEQMRQYLQSKNVEVPGSVSVDKAGNEAFTVTDPSGTRIEFIRYLSGSLHQKSKGKHLSKNRISSRVQHAGIYVQDVEQSDRFYKDILGCQEIWKYQEQGNAQPKYVYLHFPDCIEFIEYSTANPNTAHPCFLVDDMQEIITTLRSRKNFGGISKPGIGKGNRWLLNLYNADQTRVEFTEAHTVR